jgi:pimeloyl-ACP methyl ester carboxylesterase
VKAEFTLAAGTIAALDNSDRLPAGSDPAAPTVLMVPGYTGSKEDFLPLLSPLAEAGYRVVAIDQRGQFESEWATGPAGYAIAALGEEVCQLAAQLAAANSKLHLLGHSFGGLVTRAAVLAKPELFDSLTLMSSGPAALTGQRRALLDAGELVLARYGMTGLWNQLEVSAQADPRYRQSPPALRQFLRTRFLANDPVGLQVMGDALRTVQDQTGELAAAGIAVLVVYGESDDAWPPAVQADMAHRLGACHQVIPGAAHSPAVENAAQTISALLNFWQRH